MERACCRVIYGAPTCERIEENWRIDQKGFTNFSFAIEIPVVFIIFRPHFWESGFDTLEWNDQVNVGLNWPEFWILDPWILIENMFINFSAQNTAKSIIMNCINPPPPPVTYIDRASYNFSECMKLLPQPAITAMHGPHSLVRGPGCAGHTWLQ